MSQPLRLQRLSQNALETEALGEAVGKQLMGGEVIELNSDLGGGKTTFTRGLARGFGSDDKVSSPTFTLSKVYENGRRELHHFDFYRLPEAGLMQHELHDVMQDPDCSIVIEWAGIVEDVMPKNRLRVTLTNEGDDARQLVFDCPTELGYLVKGLQQ